MERILILLAYVSLGILSDVLIARYYMALSARQALRASVYAAAIPLTTFLVIARALETKDLGLFLAFTLGNAIGTYWAVSKPGNLCATKLGNIING